MDSVEIAGWDLSKIVLEKRRKFIEFIGDGSCLPSLLLHFSCSFTKLSGQLYGFTVGRKKIYLNKRVTRSGHVFTVK